jgi:hypothetical protein
VEQPPAATNDRKGFLTKIIDRKKTPATGTIEPATSPSSDWRQSWGKADDHKSVASAKPTPVQEESKATTVSSLPHADSQRPDPLKTPDRYTQPKLEEKLNSSSSGSPANLNGVGSSPLKTPDRSTQPKAEEKVNTSSSGSPAIFNGLGSSAVTPDRSASGKAVEIKPVLNKQITVTPPQTMPVVTSVEGSRMPSGARSVIDAGNASGESVHFVPVPIVTIPDARQAPTPPTPPMPFPSQGPAGAMQASPSRAFGPAPVTIDAGMANAFTAMPSKEQMAQATNAFGNGQPAAGPMMAPRMPYGNMPPNTNMVMAYNQGRPAQMPVMQEMNPHGASGQNVQQMVSTLRDSLYPSQREWAADSLAMVDWRTHPQVVQALMTAAKEDPAATVRAGCVRCLAKLNVNTMPVVTAVQALRSDTDPRVRQEAEQALSKLGASQSAVQPAGGVVPIR